jgi:manganese/zinc/iron transport system ATP- binding protein
MESATAQGSPPPALELHDLSVAYHRRPVVYGVDVAVPEGKLVGIVGPNGAGKSTLVKAALGIVPLGSGWVEFFGRPYAEVKKRVAYVPQRESVDWDFPVSAMDVVMMGRYGHLGLVRRPRAADREIASAALEKVNMLPFANRQISNLSGGQQQRVFLARALAQQGDVYLMDEPFAGVDAATEASIIELLKELRDAGKTIFVVHHDLTTAEDYFDQLILLNMRLVAYGETRDVFTPELLQKTYGGRLTILNRVAEQAERMRVSGPGVNYDDKRHR